MRQACLVPCILVLLGCAEGEPAHSETLDEAPACGRVAFDPDAVSALGFAPRALWDAYNRSYDVPAYWVDGRGLRAGDFEDPEDAHPTRLQLTLSEREESEILEPACDNRVVAPVTLELRSDDGLIEDSAAVLLSGDPAGATIVWPERSAPGDTTGELHFDGAGVSGARVQLVGNDTRILVAPGPCGAEQAPLDAPRWDGVPQRLIDRLSGLESQLDVQPGDSLRLGLTLRAARATACATADGGYTRVLVQARDLDADQTLFFADAQLSWKACRDSEDCIDHSLRSTSRVDPSAWAIWPGELGSPGDVDAELSLDGQAKDDSVRGSLDLELYYRFDPRGYGIPISLRGSYEQP